DPHPWPRRLLLEERLGRVLPPEPREVPRRGRPPSPRRAGADPEAGRPIRHRDRKLQAGHDRGEVGTRVPAAPPDEPAPDLPPEPRVRPVGAVRAGSGLL